MSMRVPDDTLDVLETLVKECQNVLPSLHIHDKLLMTGAVIDAENLIAEIKSAAKDHEPDERGRDRDEWRHEAAEQQRLK
jgi:hypothetical protein